MTSRFLNDVSFHQYKESFGVAFRIFFTMIFHRWNSVLLKRQKLGSSTVNYSFLPLRFSNYDQQANNLKRISVSKTSSYMKYMGFIFGSGISLGLSYKLYAWVWQAPICPNYDRNQIIDIRHVLACTARISNPEHSCSGRMTMKKIGAATGVNFTLVPIDPAQKNPSYSINLNEKAIALQNLFDENYVEEYIYTLGDLIVKLDDHYRSELLSNKIGYYLFVCPECRSTLTRRMISCTSYLTHAGLLHDAVDLSNFNSENGDGHIY